MLLFRRIYTKVISNWNHKTPLCSQWCWDDELKLIFWLNLLHYESIVLRDWSISLFLLHKSINLSVALLYKHSNKPLNLTLLLSRNLTRTSSNYIIFTLCKDNKSIYIIKHHKPTLFTFFYFTFLYLNSSTILIYLCYFDFDAYLSSSCIYIYL